MRLSGSIMPEGGISVNAFISKIAGIASIRLQPTLILANFE
jgi:hypothetical protein